MNKNVYNLYTLSLPEATSHDYILSKSINRLNHGIYTK